MSDYTIASEVKGHTLHITAGDRRFRVEPHTGRDAVRTRRQVRKLIIPQISELTAAREQVIRRMSDDDRKQYQDLSEQLQALGREASESKARLEKEITQLLNTYEMGSDLAQASARAVSLLDLDQEALLDDLIFKHTKAAVGEMGFQPLTNPTVFDIVFSGKASNLIDDIRQEVLDFNGFLDL
ncbi:MAG: hypothetical protein IGS03_00665 [Candidatus Sericytochromatia bacterium]|nr:hypothetical protein [Candidatus Sericytochromatia bacterium]